MRAGLRQRLLAARFRWHLTLLQYEIWRRRRAMRRTLARSVPAARVHRAAGNEVPVNGDVPARDEAPAMREYRVWRDGHSLPSLIRAADALAAIDTYRAWWPLENAVVHVQESGDAVVHVYRITQTGQVVRERFYHQGFGGDQ